MSMKFFTCALMGVLMMGMLSSCGQKTENDTDASASAADSLKVSGSQDAKDEVTGVLLDATMNTAVLVTENKDTLSFATGGAEMITPESGMMIGDTLTVTYEGDLDNRNSFPAATARKVVVRAGKHDS